MEVTLVMDDGIIKGLLSLPTRRAKYALAIGGGPPLFFVEWEK